MEEGVAGVVGPVSDVGVAAGAGVEVPRLAGQAVQEAPSTPRGASAPDDKTGSNDARLRISV